METVVSKLKAFTGVIEKAKILIADDRLAPGQKPEEVPQTGFTLAGNGPSMGANMEMAKQTSKLKDADPSVMQGTQAMVNQLEANPNYNRTFEVQFNPSTLHISGYAEEETLHADYVSSSNDELNCQKGMKTQITLDVQLIFDQISLRSAFLEDMLNISIDSIISSAAKSVALGLSKKDERKVTVQQEVEGFLSATRGPRTRRIQFAWNKLTYDGVLRNCSARYTMFDMAGQPIRAVVNLSLFLVDKNITSTNDGYWDKAFEKCWDPKNLSETGPTSAYDNITRGLMNF